MYESRDITQISPLSLEIEPLTVEQIKSLARQYLTMARLIKNELQRIEEGGVSETEEDVWANLRILRIKLENAGLSLYDKALVVLIRVDLTNFNQEIGKSTEALKKAAEQIQKIHDTIGKVIQAFGIVLDIVGTLTSGGVFQFAKVLEQTLALLEVAGVNDLPEF
jgi:DNA-directed RNA polymerase beta' subunit